MEKTLQQLKGVVFFCCQTMKHIRWTKNKKARRWASRIASPQSAWIHSTTQAAIGNKDTAIQMVVLTKNLKSWSSKTAIHMDMKIMTMVG